MHHSSVQERGGVQPRSLEVPEPVGRDRGERHRARLADKEGDAVVRAHRRCGQAVPRDRQRRAEMRRRVGRRRNLG